MKILKPNNLGVFYRFMKLNKKYGVFSYYLTFDLSNGKMLEYNKAQDKITEFCKDVQDEGFPKARAEVLLSASAYSYDNDTKAMKVGIKVGEIEKELVVFGQREWKFNLPSIPQPFKSQKIEYSEITPPIVEYPDKLVTSKNDKIVPASFNPLPIQSRLKKTPIKDYKKYWPYFPDDFDISYFNMAPKDQQKDGYFTQEDITIKNMNPTQPLIKSKIPNYNVRCFIQKDEFYEIELRKDTLWLFPDILVGMIVFRGVVEIEDERFSNIKYLYAEVEREKKEASFYYELFLKKIKKHPIEEKKERIKEEKISPFKIAKKAKTLINQTLNKAPSIKKTSLEYAKNSNSKNLSTIFELEANAAKAENKLSFIFTKMEQIADNMDMTGKDELSYPQKESSWADDGFEFVNKAAKTLISQKVYPKDFIEYSLIGLNLEYTKEIWKDKEVELWAGFVYPRFEENRLKAVRIQTQDGVVLVNGSEKNFPLKIIEKENYPFFVTNDDLEGWMVNFECYDMCNVVVCDDKEKIKEIIKENEVIIWGYDIDIEKKIKIEHKKTLKQNFYEGKLRDVFMQYLTPDSSYEDDWGFDEASKVIDNKISSKVEFAKKKMKKAKEEMDKIMKENNLKPNTQSSKPPFSEKSVLDNLDTLKKVLITFNNQDILDKFEKKSQVIKDLVAGYDKKMADADEKIKEVQEKIDSIEIPQWAKDMKNNKREKYIFNSLESSEKSVYQLDEKDKIIKDKKFIFSLFEGKIENIEFFNCKFESIIFDCEIKNCKFIECEIENCIFEKEISGEFHSTLKNNIFEKIDMKVKIDGGQKNMFLEVCFEDSEIKNLEYSNFIKCEIKNTNYLDIFNKNSFNTSKLSNMNIDVKARNLAFIGCELENINFKGDLNNIRFLKETKLIKCDLSKLDGFKSTFYEVIVEDSKFIKSNFNNTIIQKSVIKYCDFRKVKFRNARIEISTIENSLFGGSDFYRASFRGSSFNKVSLIWTNLYSVEMFNVKFKETLLDDANIEKTFLKREYFEDNK